VGTGTPLGYLPDAHVAAEFTDGPQDWTSQQTNVVPASPKHWLGKSGKAEQSATAAVWS
jgi:hypothetical protein